MFCPHCGKEFTPGTNFCSACGASLAPRTAAIPSRPIVRPRTPRMIAGVCSGFALHFSWDLTLVRICLVVFTLLSGGIGLLCYLAAWVILPEAQYALPFNAGYGSPYTASAPGGTGQGNGA